MTDYESAVIIWFFPLLYVGLVLDFLVLYLENADLALSMTA